MKTDSKAIWVSMGACALMTVMGMILLVMHVNSDSEEDVYGTYQGQWSGDYTFEAVVTEETITVHLDMDGLSGLYWLGDVDYVDGVVVSQADTEALSGSLLGSGLSEKHFYHDGDILSFDFSILGMDERIEMERVD